MKPTRIINLLTGKKRPGSRDGLEKMGGDTKKTKKNRVASTLVSGAFFAVGCMLIAAMALTMGTEEKATGRVDGLSMNAATGFEVYINNLSSHAMEGVLPIQKHYYLDESVVVAPEPDRELFGSSSDPGDVEAVLAAAEELLEGQETFWDPDIQVKEESELNWYLDDTILALSWKQVIDSMVFTFTEVKVAHPSQFRRYLAEDTFASNIQYIPSEMATAVNAVFAMSGDFYKHRSYGTVVYKGELCRAEGKYLDGCFVDSDGDLHFVKHGTLVEEEDILRFIEENDIRFSLSFGPILIQDGTIVVPGGYSVGEINSHFPRAVLCQLDRCHYLTVVVNTEEHFYQTPTLRKLANVLLDMGLQNAYVLDGGQTATMIMNNTVINSVMFGWERTSSDIIYFATAIPEKEGVG